MASVTEIESTGRTVLFPSILRRLEVAAVEAGIESDSPLGVIMEAHKDALLYLGETLDQLQKHAAMVRSGIETDARLVKAMLESGDRLVEGVKIQQSNLEIMREEALTKLVKTIGRDLVERVRDWTVFREIELNRKSAWKRSLITSAIALSLFIGGFGIAEYRFHKTYDALAACREKPEWQSKDGTPLCPLPEFSRF